MELTELYRDVILDHNRRPRNFGLVEPADAVAQGFNPLCGDRLNLSLRLAGDAYTSCSPMMRPRTPRTWGNLPLCPACANIRRGSNARASAGTRSSPR